uniref:Phosphopantothenoylcysteine decarboxylase n=1 Tax=Gadus morhua TaxID=8049 RepID=A0A8C5C6S4_GADMO
NVFMALCPVYMGGTFRVLVGVTGSVAALKLPLLVSQLLELPGVEVRVVSTEHAHHFYNPAEISVKVYTDKDEWETCVVRAWESSRPLLFCPAMNTAMWNHPITARQIASLKDFGYVEIPCIAKKLVCGDEGLFVCEVGILVSKPTSEYGRN